MFSEIYDGMPRIPAAFVHARVIELFVFIQNTLHSDKQKENCTTHNLGNTVINDDYIVRHHRICLLFEYLPRKLLYRLLIT